MRLLRIEAHHFLAYVDLDLDLTGVDQLAIVGPVGSGKSSLLDAVTWSLWGKARGSADQLIRHGYDECRVSTAWLTDGKVMTVTRIRNRKGRGETSLLVDLDGADATRHTIGETQEYIDSVVAQPSAVVFAGPLMVQGQSGEFMAMNPGERKELLFRMLALTRYGELSAKVKEELAGSAARMTAIKTRLADSEGEAADQLDAKRRLKQAEETLAGAAEMYATVDEVLTDIQAEAAALLERGRTREEAVRTVESEALRIDELDRHHAQYLEGTVRLQTMYERTGGMLAIVPCHGEGIYAACPMLVDARDIPQKLALLEAEAEARVAEYDDAKAKAKRAHAKAHKRVLQMEILPLEEMVAQVKAATQERKKAAADFEVAQADVVMRREDLRRASEAAARMTDLARQLEAEEAQRQDWTQLGRAFGRDGIPTMVMESALPLIEDQANDLLSIMPSGFALRLVTQQEQKTTDSIRETLEVVLTVDGIEQAYGLASGGEKMQVDLALRMALASLGRFETMWVDEGWGSQDKAGRDALVAGMLAADTFPLVVAVSHVDDVADRFPSRLTVSKADRESEVMLA